MAIQTELEFSQELAGAASGIGEGIAVGFAKCRACLSLADKDEANLKRVAETCKSLGADKILTITADLLLLEDIKRVIDETIEKFEKLDVLCNNVGTAVSGNIDNPQIDKFDFQFHLNVRTPLYFTQLAVPYLEKTKGNIINTSSLFSKVAVPPCLMYCMTKAAVDAMTKTTALDVAEKGIRVNSVNPSSVETNFSLGLNPEQVKHVYDIQAKKHPLGGVNVTVEEVVGVVLFLASDAAKMITGTCMFVDRGRQASGGV